MIAKTCPYTNPEDQESGHGCTNCLIRKLSLFDGLELDQLHKLNSMRSDVLFAAEEFVYKQGLKPIGLLCLSAGKVKVIENNISGSELIVTLKRPGDFLGFYDLMREDVHASSAVALENCSVCVIPEKIFHEILNTNLSLSLKINKFLAGEMIKTRQRTAALTQKYMRARLADALIYVHSFFGTSEENDQLDVELKRSDWAGLSNMSTPNAIRTLSEFAKSGFINVSGRKIAIKNLKELERISIQG